MFETEVEILVRRLAEPRRFLLVLTGPRQVGKTTAALQAMDRLAPPHLFFSADNVPGGSEWIAQRWQEARLAMEQSAERELVIAFDEIQKTANWSEAVKREWWPLEVFLPMPIARLLA